MKTLSKTKIHPLYFIVAFLFMVIGFFRLFFYMTLLIIIHEMGHIITGYLCRWKIEKVVILPFGGITVFQEKLNKPIFQECLIAIMGPVAQIAFFLLFKQHINHLLFIKCHYTLLIYNLLPIVPLDGSKLLHAILDYFFSFSFSHMCIIWISIVVSLLVLIYSFFIHNLLLLVFVSFLSIQIYKEYKNHKYLVSKFLLERYLGNYYFKRRHKINGKQFKKMKRDCIHNFYNKGKWITEKQVLKDLFSQ